MSSNRYDLHQLGWSDFQQLCIKVATQVLGQTVGSFLEGNDGGRDGAFEGEWSPQAGELLAGRYVIQCKFTARRDHKLSLSDVADEIAKVRKLVKKGTCDVYVLMTNAGVTGASNLRIQEAFEGAGVGHILIFDTTWICEKIEQNSGLRMNVPRLYGLGDLSQILDERRYKQTQALLSELKPELAKTVVTQTYRDALQALQNQGFVLLVGEPAAGKTTIAALLAMCALDRWGSNVLKLETPEQVRDHWNIEEQSQLIWVDDAFGVTQYESHLVMRWNRTLDVLAAMIKRGHKVVMTSRDYIYNQARRELKKTAFPLLEESKVVIDVKKLTAQEKEQILYNHLKLGSQTKHFLSRLKPFLPEIASNRRFVPEAARRLGNPQFTKTLRVTKKDIDDFVVKQEEHLVDTLESMDAHSHAALALIYMKRGAVESPVSLSVEEVRAIDRLGSTEAKCLKAMEHLEGSFVQLVDTESARIWRYKHPTIGDAFALTLAKSREFLRIFIDGTTTEKLMDLVTCGDVGLAKATIIPPAMFGEFVTKVYEYVRKETAPDGVFSQRHRYYSFLLHRCTREFLVAYVEVEVGLSDLISGDYKTSWIWTPKDLALRLHREKLLTEGARAKIVSHLVQQVLDGDELGLIHDEDLQEFMTPEELESFFSDVQQYVLPSLDAISDQLTSRYEYDSDPDSHVSELLEHLEYIEQTHPQWPNIERILCRQRDRLYEWVSGVSRSRRDEPDHSSNQISPNLQPRQARSIFDDVDA